MIFDAVDGMVNDIKKLMQDEASFDEVALKVFSFHYEYNKWYRERCKSPYPIRWEQIPLVQSNDLLSRKESGIDLATQMPFPGVALELDGYVNYVRDTELYKRGINKSFHNEVLNEPTWVPWINYVSFCTKQNQSPITYIMEYLAETFHGSVMPKMPKLDQIPGILNVNESIEIENGEAIEVKTPTVIALDASSISQLASIVRSSENEIAIPLGSSVVTVVSPAQKIRLEDELSICDAFGANYVMRMMCIPEISSQFYARVDRSVLQACVKKSAPDSIEFFTSNWVRFRIVDQKTGKDAAAGTTGAIALYDLSNFWSNPFVLTGYVGRIGPRGGLIVETEKVVA